MAFSEYITDNIIAVFLGLFLIGIYAAVGYVGVNSDNNNQNEKRKNIGIIMSVVFGILLGYTALIALYFSRNPAYTNFYLIGASSMSIALSLVAVSISSMSSLPQS